MTVTADAEKRTVIPEAAPGDVFACEKTDKAVILRRIYRNRSRRKLTKRAGSQGDPELEIQADAELGGASQNDARAVIVVDTLPP